MARPQVDPVRRTVIPVAVGLAAMGGALVGPVWIVAAVALVGALVAGMLNCDEPVRAGLLTVAVPLLVALIRVLGEQPSALGALAFGGVCAAAVALIASHVGAGVQRRRSAAVLYADDVCRRPERRST